MEQLLRWTMGNGYWLMFLAMLVEGPAVTAAGAFGAVLGYFNLWAVFLISILGNLLPDAAYYALGLWGRGKFIEKYGHYFKLTPERIAQLEESYHEHAGKTLTAIKLIPFVATPGLIVAGLARVPLKKYVFWSVAVTLPSSLAYLLIGYYFGAAYQKILGYLTYGGYALGAVIALFVAVAYFSKKASRAIGGKIEKV